MLFRGDCFADNTCEPIEKCDVWHSCKLDYRRIEYEPAAIRRGVMLLVYLANVLWNLNSLRFREQVGLESAF